MYMFIQDTDFPSFKCKQEHLISCIHLKVMWLERTCQCPWSQWGSVTLLNFVCRLDKVILKKHRHSHYPTVIFCKVQQKSHFVQDGIYTFGQLQLKFKPEHKWTWLAATWLPCRLCYSSSVFFHHLCLIVLSIPQWNVWQAFKKMSLLFFFFF